MSDIVTMEHWTGPPIFNLKSEFGFKAWLYYQRSLKAKT